MTNQAADAICPSCRSPNGAGARFCGSCGSSLQEGAAPPPQAPPPAPPIAQMPPVAPLPPMAPQFPTSRFGAAGMGMGMDSLNCTAPLPLPQAVEHASRVITANGGRVMPLSQTALQIEVPYKDFWTTAGMKVAFRGVLNFTPQGPQQTQLQSKLAIDWGSAAMVLGFPMIGAVLLGVTSVYFFMIWIIVGALGTAIGAWILSSSGPRKCGDKLAAALASGGRM